MQGTTGRREDQLVSLALHGLVVLSVLGLAVMGMYVYFAVDARTYDLLHIAIYPQHNQASATAFLLALRTKGYQLDVIVTDLRQDYDPVVAQSLPMASLCAGLSILWPPNHQTPPMSPICDDHAYNAGQNPKAPYNDRGMDRTLIQ